MNDVALIPEYKEKRWSSAGLTPLQERIFNWIAVLLIVTMVSGWTISIIDTYESQPVSATGEPVARRSPSRRVASAMLDSQVRSTVFLNEAALKYFDPLRGYSGKLKATFRLPGDPVAEGTADPQLSAEFLEGDTSIPSRELTAPSRPGIYNIHIQLNQARKAIDGLSLINLVPSSEKKQGRIGSYMLGSWPWEDGGTPRSQSYAPPRGFIRVTLENRDTYVSEHFQLKDFLTKDQPNVWPKYLLLEPRTLDKLELIIQDLEKQGHDVRHVTIMSGFRTPRYNHSGGNTEGRANLSRHMYGDAADFFVDNDEDGWTDDINGDGKVDLEDAEIMAAAAERVERKYPSLVGGIGIYKACCGHGPFVHVDVRGIRARWRF